MLEIVNPKMETELFKKRTTTATEEQNDIEPDKGVSRQTPNLSIELDKWSTRRRLGIEQDKGSLLRTLMWRLGRHQVRVNVEDPCEPDEDEDL